MGCQAGPIPSHLSVSRHVLYVLGVLAWILASTGQPALAASAIPGPHPVVAQPATHDAQGFIPSEVMPTLLLMGSMDREVARVIALSIWGASGGDTRDVRPASENNKAGTGLLTPSHRHLRLHILRI